MSRVTKRRGVSDGKVDRTRFYEIDEALALLKELATVKFTESVDVAINNCRIATLLLHGMHKALTGQRSLSQTPRTKEKFRKAESLVP